MKKLLIVCAIVPLFAACATQTELAERHEQKQLNKLPPVELPFMSRNEVMTAIAQCESVHQQAIIQYGTAHVNEGRISLPVNVLCIPKPQRGLISKLFD